MKVTAIVAFAVAFLVAGCLVEDPNLGNVATPTPRPSATPTSTLTPTPTLAPTPTPSASPTAKPIATDDTLPSPTVVASQTPAAEVPPGVCAEADLLWDPALHELLLVNCTTYSGGPKTLTLWGWNGASWDVVSAGPAPARVVGGAAFDPDLGQLTVYGGYVPDTDPCNTETWEWEANQWTQFEVAPPPACDHLKMIVFAGQTLLMGGQDARGVGVDETWWWNGAEWAQLDANLPPSRAHFGLQVDHAQLLLYGGLTTSAELGDFWSFHNGIWEQLDDPEAGARSHLGMVYDTDNEELLVYGGATGDDTYGTLTDDMWSFKNDSWTQLHPDVTPGKRGSASLGYDPERHLVVLYGGFDTTGNELDDTWLWDGQEWSCAANCP